jgi:hypothetical protein
MRSICKLVFLIFVLLNSVHSPASSADSNVARKAIMLRYSLMDEATRNSDTQGFASVLADNYEQFDSNNRMLKRNESIEKLNAFLGQQKRQFKTKIISAKISKTSVKVICQRIDIEEGLLWKRTDLWKLSNGTWFLTQSREDGFSIVKGGKAEKFLKELE